MSIPPSSANTGITLQNFQQAAEQHTEVYLDGERLVVLGTGQTSQGRQVAWVAPTGDAASSLADALKNAVGPGLGDAIVRELGLSPAPGKPLSARTIKLALSMAQEGRHAMEGVDYMTQLRFSAQNRTADFIRVCQSNNVDPQQLDTLARSVIDQQLAERLHVAAQAGQSPVPPQQAEAWLGDIVRQHHHRSK